MVFCFMVFGILCLSEKTANYIMHNNLNDWSNLTQIISWVCNFQPMIYALMYVLI